MSDILLIGQSEVVKPFKALGVDFFETSDPVAAGEYLQNKCAEYPLIFIAENLAGKLLKEIEKIKKTMTAVFILPEYGKTESLGYARLEAVLTKAAGKKL